MFHHQNQMIKIVQTGHLKLCLVKRYRLKIDEKKALKVVAYNEALELKSNCVSMYSPGTFD